MRIDSRSARDDHEQRGGRDQDRHEDERAADGNTFENGAPLGQRGDSHGDDGDRERPEGPAQCHPAAGSRRQCAHREPGRRAPATHSGARPARGKSAFISAARAAAGSVRDTWAATAAPRPTDCGQPEPDVPAGVAWALRPA